MFRNWIHRLLTSSNGGRASTQRSSRPRTRLSLLPLEDRITPALIYVDPDFAGPNGSTVTFNAGEPGQVTGLTLGTNAFADIESAITAAIGGQDSVILGQATHVTGVNIQINKSISIIGSGIGATVVTPNQDTDPGAGIFSWFRAIGGATVNFSQFTLNGASSTFGISEGIRYADASGTVDSVSFVNISRPANEYDGVGVVATTDTIPSVVTVTNSFFSNMGRSGVIFQDTGTVGTFTNNIYTGKGVGTTFIDIGVEISFGATALVSGNTISNCLGVAEDGSASSGIQITGPGSGLTAFGNTIIGNQVGVLVGINQDLDGDGDATDLDTPSVVLNFNNIFGNNVGISTNVAPGSAVDATQNFFGTLDGPQSDANNPTGTGNIVNDVATPTLIGPFLLQATPVATATSGVSYVSTITPPQIYAVGAGAGGGPRVDVFQNDILIASFFAYVPNFTGGVRVAVGDVDNDGVLDIITAAGVGGGPNVKVFDLAGNEKLSFFAFVPEFTGGVFLAVGDVDGDTITDIVVGAGAGGGPNVKVFDGRTATEKLSFFAYDPSFTGGVTVATGDMNFDFIDEIVTGANANATHVKTFTGRTGLELSSFFAFDGAQTGVFVGAGDTNGDGFDEIFAGLSTTLGQVGVFTANGQRLNSFQVDVAGGARPVGIDLPGNGPELIAVGSGLGQTSTVTFIDPLTGATVLSENPFLTTLPGGVFVG